MTSPSLVSSVTLHLPPQHHPSESAPVKTTAGERPQTHFSAHKLPHRTWAAFVQPSKAVVRTIRRETATASSSKKGIGIISSQKLTSVTRELPVKGVNNKRATATAHSILMTSAAPDVVVCARTGLQTDSHVVVPAPSKTTFRFNHTDFYSYKCGTFLFESESG